MFPTLFPDGTGGLDFPREISLTPHEYYCQKVMDHSGIYAKEEDFIFVAEQRCEFLAVEKQIDVSMRKGKIIDCNGEKKKMTTKIEKKGKNMNHKFQKKCK